MAVVDPILKLVGPEVETVVAAGMAMVEDMRSIQEAIGMGVVMGEGFTHITTEA